MFKSLLTLLCLPLVACGSSVADGPAASGDAVVQPDDAAEPSRDAVDVDGAIATLQGQLRSAPLDDYYADGSRLEGCWANPKGNDLDDVQHALYCSFPLEFRLCNSIALIRSKESEVASRWSAFHDCEDRVESATGNTGLYRYDEQVAATYYWAFLRKDSGLTADEISQLAAEQRPEDSGRSFPALVVVIGESLDAEVTDAAMAGLRSILQSAKTAAKDTGTELP